MTATQKPGTTAGNRQSIQPTDSALSPTADLAAHPQAHDPASSDPLGLALAFLNDMGGQDIIVATNEAIGRELRGAFFALAGADDDGDTWPVDIDKAAAHLRQAVTLARQPAPAIDMGRNRKDRDYQAQSQRERLLIIAQVATVLIERGTAASATQPATDAARRASATPPPQSARERAAVVLFEAIGSNARGLIDSLEDSAGSVGNQRHYMTMRATFGLIGCLADRGLELHGQPTQWGNPLAWLLNATDSAALDRAEGTAA